MSNENPTSTRVSAGALYDNTSAAGGIPVLGDDGHARRARKGAGKAVRRDRPPSGLARRQDTQRAENPRREDSFAVPQVRHGFTNGCADIRRAHADGIVPACKAGFRMVGRILFGKRGLAVTLCNWALPIISCVFLFSVVTYANSMTYALRLSVNGDLMGYVSDETVFTEAEKIVQQRITYLDSNTEMFSFNSDYTVEMVGYGSTMTKYQLADKMLQSMGAEISYAYGMYIGNSFYGALETKDRVDAALEDLLDQYREGGDETVQFESEISYEPGLYLTESIVSEDSIIKLITSKKSVAAYYTVVDGDSPYGILDKLEMSEEEVALLNPGFSMDSSLFIGDKILINQEEPFLAVSVTRTETYDERTPYDTTYTEDSTHYEGTSTIVQEGVKGTERVTANVSYINGIETRRKVIERVTIEEPTTEIISMGTKAKPAGVTANIPDNMPIGQFLWPVGGDGGQISEMMYGYGGYYGHSGIDISAPYGTPIYAAESGTVILASWYYGYGNCVMIQHANGMVTVYGHASYLHVLCRSAGNYGRGHCGRWFYGTVHRQPLPLRGETQRNERHAPQSDKLPPVAQESLLVR